MITDEDFFCLIRRNNGIFYYYFYDDFGRRKYRSTGQRTRAKAQKVVMQRIREKRLRDKGRQFTLFSEYARDFWNYDTCPIIQDKILRGGHYSVQHAKDYHSACQRVIIPQFGKYYLRELTTAQIQAWIVKAPQLYGVAHKTVNDYLINIRQILGQARLEGLVDSNVAEDVKPLAKDSKPHGTFTKEQIGTLLGTPWECYPAWLMALLSSRTAMRLSEIRALTVEQLREDHIVVDASWADRGEGRKTTKAGYSRVVPVNPDLLELLRNQAPGKTGLIFTTNGKVPVNSHYVDDALNEEMRRRGIPKKDAEGLSLSFHSFRYFFNSRLVIANLSGEVIRAVVGHESSEMTQHYTRLTASDQKRILAVAESIAM